MAKDITAPSEKKARKAASQSKNQISATKMRVKITFNDPILGTWPTSEEAWEHMQSVEDQSLREQEMASVEGLEEEVGPGITVFPRNEDGTPCLCDYQVRGFFKDACGMLQRVKVTKSAEIKAYKKVIDGLVFVEPRLIKIKYTGEIEICTRPLRASTAKGERIALASSESIAEGASVEFDILTLDSKLSPVIKEWLSYGRLRGIGQWRNSGKGRFVYEILSEEEFAIEGL